MIDTDRLWEKLYPAAWKLARSADPIQTRIGEAFRGFRDLKGEDFPPESRILYNEITTRITVAGAVVDERGNIAKGPVAHTLETMTETEASEIAEHIFEMFVQIAEVHFGRK